MNSALLRGAAASLLPAALLALAGCLFDSPAPNDRLAGGTIETTNGVVVSPDGKPAARITGYLLEEDAWLENVKAGKSVILDSFQTNDTGFFVMKKDTSKHASLYFKGPESGILIRQVSRRRIQDDYRGKIVLRRNADYRGQVPDSTTRAREVYLAGTPFSGRVTESGTFYINDVPPATYTVVVKRMGPDQKEEFVSGGEVVLVESDTTVPPDTTAPPDTLKPDTTKTLLIEDFEDGDNRTKLGPLLGGGYWDAFNDGIVGGNSVLTQPVNAAPENFRKALDATTGMDGNSLKVVYQMGDRVGVEKPYSFVFVEANLGIAENSKLVHYNLSEMDTVSFWAKGTGSLEVEFIQQQIGIPLQVHAGSMVTLTDEWQNFKISPQAFKCTTYVFPSNPEQFRRELEESKLPVYAQKPTTWAETGGMFRTIRFLGTGGTTFWLDDIRLHGLVLDDLVK